MSPIEHKWINELIERVHQSMWVVYNGSFAICSCITAFPPVTDAVAAAVGKSRYYIEASFFLNEKRWREKKIKMDRRRLSNALRLVHAPYSPLSLFIYRSIIWRAIDGRHNGSLQCRYTTNEPFHFTTFFPIFFLFFFLLRKVSIFVAGRHANLNDPIESLMVRSKVVGPPFVNIDPSHYKKIRDKKKRKKKKKKRNVINRSRVWNPAPSSFFLFFPPSSSISRG